MIRPADAGAVLDLLSAAFPTHPMPPASVELYVAACTSPPFQDASVLLGAANALVRTTDRFPTVNQLTNAYQEEARRRVRERAEAEADRVLAAGGLPGVALDPGYAVEMVDVIRTAYERAVATVVHNHAGGDASRCPTCSRRDEIAAAITAGAVQVAAERGLRPPAGIETFACPDCRDLGWVATERDPASVRPCGRCNETAYERWIDGHLLPGHSCADCRGARR